MGVFTIKKLYLFSLFLLSINLISVIQATAFSFNMYDVIEQTNTFEYVTSDTDYSGYNANRIATENFEYTNGTNLYYLSQTNIIQYVTNFTDIDFTFTNRSYLSMGYYIKCNISSVAFTFIRDISNEYTFERASVRTIIKPLSSDRIYFRFYFSTTTYVSFEMNYANRALVFVVNDTTIYAITNFMPIRYYYDFIYIDFDWLYGGTVESIPKLFYYAYNSTTKKLYYNEHFPNLTFYRYNSLSRISLFHIMSQNDEAIICAEDFNCFYRKDTTSHVARWNPEYEAYDIRTFYLTHKENTYNQFNSNAITNNGYEYATTIFKGRYLNYRTNYVILSNGANTILADNVAYTLRHAFRFYFSCFTLTYPTAVGGVDFVFKDVYGVNRLMISLELMDYDKNDRYYIRVHKDGREIGWQNVTSYSQTGKFECIAQFKNNLFQLAIKHNQNVSVFNWAVPFLFSDLVAGYPLHLLDYRLEYLSTNMISEVNTDSLAITNDRFCILGVIDEIDNYYYYTDSFYVTSNRFTQAGEYRIVETEIINLQFIITRTSENGEISLGLGATGLRYSVFNGTNDLSDTLEFNFLAGTDGGYIEIYAFFIGANEDNVGIEITTRITYRMLLTDEAEASESIIENLLTTKAMELFLPFVILFGIAIGFKSHNNSKYLAFVGIYIGLLVFYLTDYVTLPFMIVCMVFTSIALYFIVKREGDGL